MTKGGVAHSKDSDKHQTSLWNPSQHVEMKEKAHRILCSFGLSDHDRKKYNTVSNKSEAHFVEHINPIYEQRSLICLVDSKKENL